MDFKAILKAIWPPFSLWLMMVVTVVEAGQPGVICVTPMAWLLALWVGLRCAEQSRSQIRSMRLAESALAGGLLGLFQGALFVAITPMMGPIKADEQQKMIVLDLIAVVVGALVSAILSLTIAASQEKHRSNKTD